MSAPRQVLPGSVYLITRRCTQRETWLRPSKTINNIFKYCVAYAARRYGVKVHAACILGNHWHAVVTDLFGNIPDFTHWVHEYVAKCINKELGRRENLWSSEEPNYTRLLDDAKVLDRIVYTLTNPVDAELVPHGRDWPGFITSPRDLAGATITATRPSFFSSKGKMPATIELEICRPALTSIPDDGELVRTVQRMRLVRERELRARVKGSGRAFMGVQQVLLQRPGLRAKTPEPRRRFRPRFAASTPGLRQSAIQAFRAFREAYARCRELFAAGDRTVVFPPGTYALRRHCGVAVASAEFG